MLTSGAAVLTNLEHGANEMTDTPQEEQYSWLDELLETMIGEGTFSGEIGPEIELAQQQAKAAITAKIEQEKLAARIDEALQAYLTSADQPDADVISRELKQRLTFLKKQQGLQ